MRTLASIMIAGALGAGARYGVDGWVNARTGGHLPWGTFVINVTGSFLLGLLYTLLTHRFAADAALRSTITTGFIGSYTTFSTLTLETLQLGEEGRYVAALANSLGSLVIGMIAVTAGVACGRLAAA